MTTKFPISRRTLLRGAGVTLALPWLEAMGAPSGKISPDGKTQAPVRMGFLYMPNGVNVKMWNPIGEGRDYQLSPTLEPLAGLKDKTLVLSNLWNAAANTGDGHYVKESSILTGTTITKTMGVDLNMNGISLDQLAAQRTKNATPIPSLELGIEPIMTGVDTNVGYTRVYGCHIAWSAPTTPLAREINPRSVYQRLYNASKGGGNTAKQDVMLLDRVLKQGNELRSKLGTADKARVDEYFAILRSLEQRLEHATKPGKSSWKARVPVESVPEPTSDPKTHTEHVRLMMDMIALAFQSDTTRISTFMFGNAVSGQNFRFLDGVTNSHHEISHHSNNEEKLHEYYLITKWHIEQYAYLLNKLASMKEGEGTVLDNSMIMFASALSDGNAHNPHKLPILLGGLGGGRIDAGQHLVYTEDSPLTDLYVSMLDAFGTPVERFADSNGPLRGVLKS